MNFSLSFGPWDYALLSVVSLQATAIAYLHRPKFKVLLMGLPLPFTLATLALGDRLNVTHISGLMALLLYTHGVRLLHYNARVPIVAAIAVSAAGYSIIGTCMAGVLPVTAAAFWIAAGLGLGVAFALFAATPHREEPGHRTPLPIWMKLPIVASVIFMLIVAKHILSGFMTLFPMVGVIAAYEARRSLWAVCRQIHALALAFVPMAITIWLVQGRVGLGRALVAGWAVYLLVLVPLSWRMWFAAPQLKSAAGEFNNDRFAKQR